MEIITILSPTPGCGKTTLAVNLASGLYHQGFKVLLITPAENPVMQQWSGITATTGLTPQKSYLPIDIVFSYSNDLDFKQFAEYDYIIVDAGNRKETWNTAIINTGLILCAIEAGTGDVPLLISLDHYIMDITNQDKSIDLIIPYKARAAEWEHNFRQFSELVEHFGEQRIANMIPFCEAIHDLPLEKKSVWDLPPRYRNRQAAFEQLLDRLL